MLQDCLVVDCSDELGWLAGRMLADLGAEVFKIDPPGASRSPAWQAYNVGKRVVDLDLGSDSGWSTLEQLLARADVLIECTRPGGNLIARFEPERLSRLNPALVHVSITPFGRTGPRSTWRASDLELMAASGAMSLAGEPDGEPLRVSEPQSYLWAGAHGALGALVALEGRSANGRGQHVDVSAQAAVVPALSHAPTFVDLLDVTPTRGGAFMTGRAISGARFRAFWPCADGYLNFILYGGPAGRRTNEQLVAWMRETGADPGVLGAVNWAEFNATHLTQEQIDALEVPIGRFFAGITKEAFLNEASRREMLGYPVFTVADIATDPQLAAREFWDDAVGPDGIRRRYCGAFVRVDGERAALRTRTAGEGETAERLVELGFGADEAEALAMQLCGEEA